MRDVLTVLIAGHRTHPRLPAEPHLSDLYRRLDEAIFTLRTLIESKMRLRLLTGVAPGTDTIVADIAAKHQIPLHLLAAGQPQAITENQQKAERIVWQGAADVCMHADELLPIRDNVALSFADLVIVLWDGETPVGFSGGTVRLAFQAALLIKPVIWLNTNKELRFLDRVRLTPASLHLLQAPHPDVALLRSFFSTSLDNSAFISRLGLEVKEFFDTYTHAIPTEPSENPLSSVIDVGLAQADRLANRASLKYRLFNWFSYSAGALAVFAAVSGAIYLWPRGHSNNFWLNIELLLIIGIMAGVILAKTRDWHGRWISNRFIAEQLRYLKLCLPMLCIPQYLVKPLWHVKQGQLSLVSDELKYLQRCLTIQGLPSPVANTPYKPYSVEAQREQLNAIQKLLNEQRLYHARKHRSQHRLNENMHTLSLLLFGLTLLAVIFHYFIHADWLLIFTAVLPALAAAIHGISAKLEIGRLAGQSQVTAHELESLTLSMQEISPDTSWKGFLQIRKLTLSAAHVMSGENIRWQELISHQEAGLPT